MSFLKSFIIFGVLFLTACTTVANRNQDAGISREFVASYEIVVRAAETALTNQKLKTTGTNSGLDQTTLTFSKPVSAFSWGETGRIIVKKLDDNRSQVFVTSARNVPGNITATSEKSFAQDIFAEIDQLLQNN